MLKDFHFHFCFVFCIPKGLYTCFTRIWLSTSKKSKSTLGLGGSNIHSSLYIFLHSFLAYQIRSLNREFTKIFKDKVHQHRRWVFLFFIKKSSSCSFIQGFISHSSIRHRYYITSNTVSASLQCAYSIFHYIWLFGAHSIQKNCPKKWTFD